jgi:hypothetical protein
MADRKKQCPTSGGRIPELADSLSAKGSLGYEQKTNTLSDFMFHYPDFGLSLEPD